MTKFNVNNDGHSKADLAFLKELHESMVDKHRSIVRESVREIKKIAWELKWFPKTMPKKEKK